MSGPENTLDREGRLFAAACELPPDEREAFLARECGDDEALRARLLALLAADEGEGLEQPAVEGLRARLGAGGRPPARIGPYEIVGVLGRGGMGVVYEARQSSPERSVALKVVRPGLVGEALLRRFEHEARVLGWLNHPGIAQIYEAGTADTGDGPQPFFAMELVRGEPLTAHADRVGLDARGRLELLARVCDAVHHAHQKGVVHRDLKPGNVLVDGEGRPKIVDFGVARVTDADVNRTTQHTAVGEIVGTLGYMSPEQVAGRNDAVDTRSDVYALGVIAHELLAGRTPFDLSGKLLHEAARIVVEDEPSTLGALDAAYKGDVETIVAKALEKDAARRYGSAEELAADLRRFLRDEPIAARPASTFYQARKFARRNKALVLGLATTLLALLAGTVLSTWQYLGAEAARRVAVEAGDLARDRQRAAEEASERARAEAQAATQVKDFLVELFARANPLRSWEGAPTLRDLLDQGAEQIVADLDYQPRVQAELMSTISYSYQVLYETDAAARLAERAAAIARTLDAPEDQPLVVTILGRLGRVRIDQERYEEALAALTEAHERAVALFGRGHGTELGLRTNLGVVNVWLGNLQEAYELLASARAEIASHEFTPEEGRQDVVDNRLANWATLAQVLFELGRTDESLATYEELLADLEAQGRVDEAGASPLFANLAYVYLRSGHAEEAEATFARHLALHERFYGDATLLGYRALSELAQLAERRGDLALAETRTRAALDVLARRDEARGESALAERQRLAALLETKGELEAALEVRLEYLALVAEPPVEPSLLGPALTDLRDFLRQMEERPEGEVFLPASLDRLAELGLADEADRLAEAVFR